MKKLRVIPLAMLLLVVACGEDEEDFDVFGTLRIGSEEFPLGQSSLFVSEDRDGIFAIHLYPGGTVVTIDEFNRPNIERRAPVDGADFQIWGLNSPLDASLGAGEYKEDFVSASDFTFSDAEVAVLRNASDGAGNIVIYEYESGTFSVNSQTSEDFSLSWDMIFINNDPPFDEVVVTGSYQGVFLYSEF